MPNWWTFLQTVRNGCCARGLLTNRFVSFGQRRCWGAPHGGWVVLVPRSVRRPGPRMVNKWSMRRTGSCTTHAATGQKSVSWQRSLARLFGCAGRPTGAGWASLLFPSAPVTHPFGRHGVMVTVRIRCFLAGIHHRLRVAVIGHQMASTSFSRRTLTFGPREKTGWFQRAERGPFQLTTGPLAMGWPLPSTDGKRLFINGSQERYEFLRYDLKSGELVPALAGVSGTDLEFSKDGKWVAYVSEPEGSLWRSAVDGSQRLQLTSPPFGVGLPHWSPDEKQIAFCARRGGNPGRVYLVSVDGAALKRITNGEGGKEGDIDPSWSPDGVSLAFGDYPPVTSGASIHVVDLKSSRVSVLPGSEGMWSPRWSPNGRFIAGLSTSGSVVLYDFRTHKQSALSSVSGGYPDWSPDGELLFYRTLGNDPSWWRVRMRDRKTERIPIPKNIRVTDWFALAPNNSLITARSVGTDEIYALDWEAP